MTNELLDYINKLNIYVYVLSDGSTVLGKLVEVHPSSVEVVGLCKMQPVLCADNTIQQMMIPVIPASLEQTTILALAHIMIQSPASIVLKKAYCDTLLKLKLNKISESTDAPSNSSNQFENLKGKLKSKNPFKDRWT